MVNAGRHGWVVFFLFLWSILWVWMFLHVMTRESGESHVNDVTLALFGLAGGEIKEKNFVGGFHNEFREF